MARVFIRRAWLPAVIRGVTIPTEDGDYIVIVNDCLTPEAQRRAARHELAHIREDHFREEIPVEDAEWEAGKA